MHPEVVLVFVKEMGVFKKSVYHVKKLCEKFKKEKFTLLKSEKAFLGVTPKKQRFSP